MIRNRIIAALFLLGCDHESEPPPVCAQWLECYSACSTAAVLDLDEDTILACDSQCRVELDYDADEPAPEPGGSWRSPMWKVVVSKERGAVHDQIDAREALDDGDVDWALSMANRSEMDLALSLKARGECYAYGW
jgi:hypothetical protein